ncbi:MAG: alpha-ketoglutarate-dependent dioxygenase AlkB [Myxococcota bacterium]
MLQACLFGREAPVFDPSLRGLSRTWLDDESWVDHEPGFMRGHEALFEMLRTQASWREESREMYERVVAVPRLLGHLPSSLSPAKQLLEDLSCCLSERYGVALYDISLALYRDGEDSVAWHGDRCGGHPSSVVVTLSLGAPRRFLLRRPGAGLSRRYSLGWGDLLVMGGACQRLWQHAVPKARHADARLVIMFREDLGSEG